MNIIFTGRAKKTTTIAPNGQLINAGDVFDPDAFKIGAAQLKLWKDKRLAAATDAPVTLVPARSAIETEIARLEPHTAPDATWTKAALQSYLDAQEVPYSAALTKAELLSLCDPSIQLEGGDPFDPPAR